MKNFQKLFLYFLIVLVFTGSVGISVFGHFCSIDGQEFSYFVPKEDTCVTPLETESCCHKKNLESQKNQKIQEEKCCSETVSYFKISTENADEILKLKFTPKYTNAFLLFPEIFPSIYAKENQIAQNQDGPPKKSGREILIAFQVFRI